MAKDEPGYPVGNTDPEQRGRNLPRPEREPGGKDRGQRGDVGYGDVTENPNKDKK